MDVDGTVRATHQPALNQAFTRQLRRVGSRNQRREALHQDSCSAMLLHVRIRDEIRDSARRHFYLSLCFEFSP
jgi:hypothetical protein